MKFLKITGVIVGALVITALGIDAADTLRGNSGTLLSQLVKTQSGICPDGMIEIANHQTLTCADMYEASPGEMCPVQNPTNLVESQKNIEASCMSVSQKDRKPWTFITREQAAEACVQAGKRLPTAEEWYDLALGTHDIDVTCNVHGEGVKVAGASESCISASGAYDVVGNVWEWVRDDVIDGMHNGRKLPESGFVSQVDAYGIATIVARNEQMLFGEDYFWSKASGAFGMIRGGFYGSERDAGVYAVHADTAPTTAAVAIGFRCVK